MEPESTPHYAPKLARVAPLPTSEEIRNALTAAVRNRYGRAGVKGFALASGLPYDRVRDHLTGHSKMTLDALFEYMAALDMTMPDLMRLVDALPPGEQRGD